MFGNKLVVIVLPAFNAEKTLEHVYNEVLSQEFVDKIILVDDASTDDTLMLANSLNFSEIISLQHNIGYGGNQKVCYEKRITITEHQRTLLKNHQSKRSSIWHIRKVKVAQEMVVIQTQVTWG